MKFFIIFFSKDFKNEAFILVYSGRLTKKAIPYGFCNPIHISISPPFSFTSLELLRGGVTLAWNIYFHSIYVSKKESTNQLKELKYV